MITVTLQSEVNKPNINGHIYTESAMNSVVAILNSKEVPVYRTGNGTPIAQTVVGSGKLVDGKVMVTVNLPADEKIDILGFGCYDMENEDFDDKTQEVKQVTDLHIEIE
jgi:hypothetical protein